MFPNGRLKSSHEMESVTQRDLSQGLGVLDLAKNNRGTFYSRS